MSLNCKLLPDKGYERLEPDVMKVASPVLRGLGAGNGPRLLDYGIGPESKECRNIGGREYLLVMGREVDGGK